MASVNRVILIGNVTRDPELRRTAKGTAVTEIGMAMNRKFKGPDDQQQEETTFVDVTLWGRQAELAEQYLRKGDPVFIEGRLNLDQWEDRQTGQKRYRLRVVGEQMQFLGKGSGGGGGRGSGGSVASGGDPRPGQSGGPNPEDDDFLM
jgi:single-strand DNA-binding protein